MSIHFIDINAASVVNLMLGGGMKNGQGWLSWAPYNLDNRFGGEGIGD